MTPSTTRKTSRQSAPLPKKRAKEVTSLAVSVADPDDNAVELTGSVSVVSGGLDGEPLRFRLTIRQSDGMRETVDCEAVRATSIRTVQKLRANEKVRIQGALRRRFWRGATGGLTSRTFVLVQSAARLR